MACSKKTPEPNQEIAEPTISEGPASPNLGGHGSERSDAKNPVSLPGKLKAAPWLDGATRVIAVPRITESVPGPVIVAAGLRWLRWFDAKGEKLGERTLKGAVQVLEAVDIDGDGVLEILVGSGRGRDAGDAPISLEIHRLGEQEPKLEELPLPTTARAQVVGVGLAGVPGQLWVASYVSKFEVAITRFTRDETGLWEIAESRGRHRVVGSMTVLADGSRYGTPVVARMYGADADAPGGVYELVSESEKRSLPTIRGARAVLALPGSPVRLMVADGWHKHYAKRAQGYLSVFSREIAANSASSWQLQQRIEVKENYGYQRLRSGDVMKSPGLEVVASGNGTAVVLSPDNPDLLFEISGVIAVDAFPVNLHGDSRMEVVIVGPKAMIWSAM